MINQDLKTRLFASLVDQKEGEIPSCDGFAATARVSIYFGIRQMTLIRLTNQILLSTVNNLHKLDWICMSHARGCGMQSLLRA